MQDVVLNADILHTMLYNGYCELKRNASVVDNLNVFPVPDGDTGTNMTKTFEGGVRSVSSEVSDTGEYMRRFAQGNLLGARGNSGVILSQFMRGIAQYTGEKESLP
ncbi:MAG TPA: DAK2 domain-containing protein [Eubacteriales bacterium]|nr:DAK2 domain-containing protein [Eubacteriales bacterium]